MIFLSINALNIFKTEGGKNQGLYEHFQRNTSVDRTQCIHKYIGLREGLLSFPMSIYYYKINYP